MTRNRQVFLGSAIVGITLLAATTGCAGRNAAEEKADEPLALRTYKVPGGLENDVRSMLRNVLGGDAPVGRVTGGPGGTLVVVAPESLHAGIEGLLGELEAVDTPSLRPVPIELTYWILAGTPEPDLREGHRAAPGSRLDAIAPVLSELVQSQGAMEFRLIERIELASIGEEHGQITGRSATIRQRAWLVGGEVVADVQITTSDLGAVQTRVKLAPEQILVLGQSGYRDPQDASEGTLFYVVSSDVES
jgi:hypothetical protein